MDNDNCIIGSVHSDGRIYSVTFPHSRYFLWIDAEQLTHMKYIEDQYEEMQAQLYHLTKRAQRIAECTTPLEALIKYGATKQEWKTYRSNKENMRYA